MKQFRLVDNLLGWLAFAIAAYTYCSTIEPTASFWDCPEFITTGYKLEVGHPPGAPFFMLTANFFSQLVSDPLLVAKMVNTMSALFSALCILFLFWSISHLTRKLICEKGWVSTTAQLITIEGSAMVGALAYCFSDTFWFSAVEGEVYAYSSLFTAVVFWLMLKWEDNADKPGSDRWLILIAYLTGLSIGVHLLNLLCVPALVLIFYFRKTKEATAKGALLALVGSAALVAAVLYGIVPGIVKVGGVFELFFVNTLGMSFNSGVIVYIITAFSCVAWAIWETTKQQSRQRMNIAYTLCVMLLGIPFYGHGFSSFLLGIVLAAVLFAVLYFKKNGNPIISARAMNTSLLCMLMIMIGYGSYAVIVVRSTANPPMDQNSPEDIFTLGTYLNREQYGDRPLFYGQAFTSQLIDIKDGATNYVRKEKYTPEEPDEYTNLDGSGREMHKPEYIFDKNMLFPRMYSSQHAESYNNWMGGSVELTDEGLPTFGENMKFFVSYQLYSMYWRYFLWNFAGRQNDIQGNTEATPHGNWLTGFSFIDNARLGDQSKLPDDLKNNKGHNVYYCLPLLLGLIGLLWQLFKGQKGEQHFLVVMMLFFMTGLAIVLYLNQTPDQPRERDYAYAGSFYAFAIWIGLGVAALVDWLNQLVAKKEGWGRIAVASLVSLVALGVPAQMASQSWDDHDRSGRYTCRDFGRNYLESLSQEGAPIVFTNGDNDTFPLWYAQDTEGFRTDARVCNLSYLQTDWYIDQMKRPAYDSPALPIHFTRMQYLDGGLRDITYVRPELLKEELQIARASLKRQARKNPNIDVEKELAKQFGEDPYELKNIIDKWVLSDSYACIPTDSLVINIDKEAVLRSGMMIPDSVQVTDSTGTRVEPYIPSKMIISLRGTQRLTKSELMILELVSQCNWERPVYVACTVGRYNYRFLQDYTIQEGLAMRITPFNMRGRRHIDTEKMYDNFMNRFKFGGIDKKGIYLDETVMRMCRTHRNLGIQLASTLFLDHDYERARKVLEYSEKMIPAYNVPYDDDDLGTAQMWWELYRVSQDATAQKKAEEITMTIAKRSIAMLDWILSLSDHGIAQNSNRYMEHLGVLQQCTEFLGDGGCEESAQKTATNLYEFAQKGGLPME